MAEVRFQDTIKDLSTAVRNKQPITFTEAEAAALMRGFVEMSQSIGSSAEIIERLEAQTYQEIGKKKKLWSP